MPGLALRRLVRRCGTRGSLAASAGTGTSPARGHRPLALLAALLPCLFPVTLAAAPNAWRALGPDGGAVRALAIDPSNPATLYAGTYDGMVFKSTSGGASWTSLSSARSGLFGLFVQMLAIDPSNPATVFAVTNFGLFKSADGGGSWKSVKTPLSISYNALIFDPTHPGTLYLAAEAVYKSVDGGVTWQNLNVKFAADAMVMDPTNPATLYAGGSHGMFKTTDGGATWTAVNSGLWCSECGRDIIAAAIDPLHPSTLYASTFFGGIFKTVDGGASWTAVNSGLPNINTPADPEFDRYTLAIDPVRPSTLYAGGYEGSFKSTDGGASWTAIPGLASRSTVTLAIDSTSPSTVYAGGNGVLKSDDAGASWTAVDSGLAAQEAFVVTVDPANPATLYLSANGGLFKSIDGGTSWSFLRGYVPDLKFDPTNPSILYAAAYGEGVLRSTDGGTSWQALGPAKANVLTVVIDPKAPATLYAAAYGAGVFKTTDGGASWTASSSGIPLPAPLLTLAIDPAHPATLYAGFDAEFSNHCGIFKSTDGALHWTELACNPIAVQLLAFDPTDPATVYAGTFDSGLLRSTDAGATWRSAGMLPADGYISGLAFDPGHPGTLYADGFGNGDDGAPDAGEVFHVWKSSDGARSWGEIGSGQPQALAWSLAFDPRTATLYAGTRGQSLYTLKDVGACLRGAGALCLDDQPGDGRFEIRVHYHTIQHGTIAGDGAPIDLSGLGVDHGGLFTFFEPSNPEMLVKVVDACAFDHHFWTFISATTNVGFTVTVRDTATGAVKTYSNPDLTPAPPVQDTAAFTCSGSGKAAPASEQAAAARARLGPTIGTPAAPPPVEIAAAAGCTPGPAALCIGGRFKVTAAYQTAQGGGLGGPGQAIDLTDLRVKGGVFWFFSADNPEMLIKVVDGCALNGKYWVFFTSGTNVGLTVTVTDTQLGGSVTYQNPDLTPAAPVQDTSALSCS